MQHLLPSALTPTNRFVSRPPKESAVAWRSKIRRPPFRRPSGARRCSVHPSSGVGLSSDDCLDRPWARSIVAMSDPFSTRPKERDSRSIWRECDAADVGARDVLAGVIQYEHRLGARGIGQHQSRAAGLSSPEEQPAPIGRPSDGGLAPRAVGEELVGVVIRLRSRPTTAGGSSSPTRSCQCSRLRARAPRSPCTRSGLRPWAAMTLLALGDGTAVVDGKTASGARLGRSHLPTTRPPISRPDPGRPPRRVPTRAREPVRPLSRDPGRCELPRPAHAGRWRVVAATRSARSRLPGCAWAGPSASHVAS